MGSIPDSPSMKEKKEKSIMFARGKDKPFEIPVGIGIWHCLKDEFPKAKPIKIDANFLVRKLE